MASLAAAGLLASGCGQTYRPIAYPVTLPGGNPQATHYALVVNNNPGSSAQPGSATQIDVSGDTNLANHAVGLNPVHAVIDPNLGTAYVVNQGDNTLSAFEPSEGASGGVATIPLIQITGEPNAGASYVATGGGFGFVVESALNRVVIATNGTLEISAFVPVGANPVAVAATSDGRKAYVTNQGSNSVSVISTKDNTNTGNIPVGTAPGPIAISADNNYVFVANTGDGTISVISTTSDSEIFPNTSGPAGGRLQAGTDPSQLIYDNGLKRLYAVNTGSGSVSIFDANTFPQTLLRTVTTSPSPVAVAPLDNGTKFYVLFQGTPGSVEVYDAQGFYKRSTITVGNNTLPNGLPMVNQVLLAASPGSLKVYAVNYHGDAANPSGSTSIIRTLDDTVVLDMPAAAPNPTFVTAQ